MSVTEEKYYNVPDFNYIVDFRDKYREAIKDYHYFKVVYINPRALLNMINHAIIGGENEIAGQLIGHFGKGEHEYYITNSILYPVQGNEFSVTVTSAEKSKAIELNKLYKSLGRPEDDIGWYHSHPGLHCFYSETDVKQHKRDWSAKWGTFCGLVIDPINTIISSHLHLGAYSINDPEKEKNAPPPTRAQIEKYGHACNKYYELELHYFSSGLDKVILNDFISKTYGICLRYSPLSTNAKCLINDYQKSLQDVKKDDDKDPMDFKDKITSINQSSKLGLWVYRKKKFVFG